VFFEFEVCLAEQHSARGFNADRREQRHRTLLLVGDITVKSAFVGELNMLSAFVGELMLRTGDPM